MLKKVNFSGVVLVDTENPKSTSEILRLIRQNLWEVDISCTVHDIKRLSDIPDEWKCSTPLGHKINGKSCEEIFRTEIVPQLELEDSKQNKFAYYDETKNTK